MTCEVRGGNPSPLISWIQINKDGVEKTIETKNATNINNVTTLEMNALINRNDLNSKFKCHVKHDVVAENDHLDSIVQLDIDGN